MPRRSSRSWPGPPGGSGWAQTMLRVGAGPGAPGVPVAVMADPQGIIVRGVILHHQVMGEGHDVDYAVPRVEDARGPLSRPASGQTGRGFHSPANPALPVKGDRHRAARGARGRRDRPQPPGRPRAGGVRHPPSRPRTADIQRGGHGSHPGPWGGGLGPQGHHGRGGVALAMLAFNVHRLGWRRRTQLRQPLRRAARQRQRSGGPGPACTSDPRPACSARRGHTAPGARCGRCSAGTASASPLGITRDRSGPRETGFGDPAGRSGWPSEGAGVTNAGFSGRHYIVSARKPQFPS